ncbi:MAG: VOC family protein [Pseudomonadota bacterium]
MALLNLDHLAVSVETLSQGAAQIETQLGISLPVGGDHPLMGTHNRLTGMGPELYFEVIAINPDAPAPKFDRWFNLDRFSGRPRLTNWILNTSDMGAALDALPDIYHPPLELTRDDLRWRMAVPKQGQGLWSIWGPAVIQWDCATHPTQMLPDCGLRLSRLTLHHPDAIELAETLAPLMPRDTAQFVADDTAKLVATFNGPNGEMRLE